MDANRGVKLLTYNPRLLIVRQDSNLPPPLGTERACNLRTRIFLTCSALPMSYAPPIILFVNLNELAVNKLIPGIALDLFPVHFGRLNILNMAIVIYFR